MMIEIIEQAMWHCWHHPLQSLLLSASIHLLLGMGYLWYALVVCLARLLFQSTFPRRKSDLINYDIYLNGKQIDVVPYEHEEPQPLKQNRR